jgi:hypothetical protein
MDELMHPGDELMIEGTRYKVHKITFSGATLHSMSVKRVKMEDKKGKKHEFDAVSNRSMMISSDYGGIVFRGVRKLMVTPRSEFMRDHDIAELPDEELPVVKSANTKKGEK